MSERRPMTRRALAIVATGCAVALAIAASGGPLVAAHAQDDAGIARVEVRWERPPAGTLERGALGVPAWTVIGVGSIAVLAAAAGLVASMRRARGERR